MSVAVAHHPIPSQSATSPMDNKNVVIKPEDRQLPPNELADSAEQKSKETNAPAQPLAPPPRPSQAQANAEQGDYFASGKKDSTHLSREPNPFEKSFGQPSSESQDSKSLLPPVSSLTSPAPLTQEGPATGGYSFASSLRSGPLSPAMLGGPVGSGQDYFGPQAGTTFPGVTPNESSLRTGLTPGGGGSMFPAPSPNSQAYLQTLANGGTTPSTLDFHRTAINAAAASKTKQLEAGAAAAQENKTNTNAAMDPLLQQQSNSQTSFGQHDSDAANGLFLLAQATNGQQAQPYPAAAANNPRRSAETSPHTTHTNLRNGSMTGSAQGSGDMSDDGDQQGMSTRSSRGTKKSSGNKAPNNSNGRRKADETPSKQPVKKKARGSMIAPEMDDESEEDDEDAQIKDENGETRKMTDEEKRKNFLERNRVAALKCRQRKKQWLQNLQTKVEMFSTENDSLTAQVHALRDEVVGLKTLLLQHKDCPISQSQGLHQYFQQQSQEFNPHANPYGIGLPNGGMQGPRR